MSFSTPLSSMPAPQSCSPRLGLHQISECGSSFPFHMASPSFLVEMPQLQKTTPWLQLPASYMALQITAAATKAPCDRVSIIAGPAQFPGGHFLSFLVPKWLVPIPCWTADCAARAHWWPLPACTAIAHCPLFIPPLCNSTPSLSDWVWPIL